jgi:hypothetical protein
MVQHLVLAMRQASRAVAAGTLGWPKVWIRSVAWKRTVSCVAIVGAGGTVLVQPVFCAAGAPKERAPFNPRDRRAATEAEHGIVKDRREMWRENPYHVDPDTLVVAVFGITGAGKSSTCNTMIGSRERLFEQSTSIMSITKAVSYRCGVFTSYASKRPTRCSFIACMLPFACDLSLCTRA